MKYERHRPWLPGLSRAGENRLNAPSFIGSGRAELGTDIPIPGLDDEMKQYLWQMAGGAGGLKPATETQALIAYPNSQDYQNIVVPGCGVLSWIIQYWRDVYDTLDQLMVDTRELLGSPPGFGLSWTLDAPWSQNTYWGLATPLQDFVTTKQRALERACLGLWKILKWTRNSFAGAKKKIAKYNQMAELGDNLPFRFGPATFAQSWQYVDALKEAVEADKSGFYIPVSWIIGLDVCEQHPELLYKQTTVDIYVRRKSTYDSFSTAAVDLACFYYLLTLYQVQRPSINSPYPAHDVLYTGLPECGIDWEPLALEVPSPIPGPNTGLLIHAMNWQNCVDNQFGTVKSRTNSGEGWLLSSGWNIQAESPPDVMPMAGNSWQFTDETRQRFCQELMRAGMNHNVTQQVQQFCQAEWDDPANPVCKLPPDPPQLCP